MPNPVHLSGSLNNCGLNGVIPRLMPMLKDLAEGRLLDSRYMPQLERFKQVFADHYHLNDLDWKKYYQTLKAFEDNFYLLQYVLAPVLRAVLVSSPGFLQQARVLEENKQLSDQKIVEKYTTLTEGRYYSLTFEEIKPFYHAFGIGIEEHHGDLVVMSERDFSQVIALKYHREDRHFEFDLTAGQLAQAEQREREEQEAISQFSGMETYGSMFGLDQTDRQPTVLHNQQLLNNLVQSTYRSLEANHPQSSIQRASRRALSSDYQKILDHLSSTSPPQRYLDLVTDVLKLHQTGKLNTTEPPLEVPADARQAQIQADEALAKQLQKQEIDDALAAHRPKRSR